MMETTNENTDLVPCVEEIISETVDDLVTELELDFPVIFDKNPDDPLYVHGNGKENYGYSDKVRAVVTYVLNNGNMRKTIRDTNIGLGALHHWRRKPWWKELTLIVKDKLNERQDLKLSQILDKATDELFDRVSNGNVRILKNGMKIRVPLNSEELALHGIKVPAERLEQLRKPKPTGKEIEQVDQVLERLCQRFEEISNKLKPAPVLIEDGEIVDP